MGTHNGYLHTFLASLPMVYDFHASRVLYLTSLLEMTVLDVTKRQSVARIELETEPAFCGLGPHHAAMGMNNQVRPCSVPPFAAVPPPCDVAIACNLTGAAISRFSR